MDECIPVSCTSHKDIVLLSPFCFVKSAKKQERIRILIKIVKRIQRRILVIPFSNYAKPVKESYGFQQHAQQNRDWRILSEFDR